MAFKSDANSARHQQGARREPERRSRARVGRRMCTTPPPGSKAVLMMGIGVCCMGMVNASLGFMMLGERGVENREWMRSLLKPKPQ